MENHGKPRKTKGNSVAFTILFSFYFILFLSSITQTYLIEDPGIQGSTLRLVMSVPSMIIHEYHELLSTFGLL